MRNIHGSAALIVIFAAISAAVFGQAAMPAGKQGPVAIMPLADVKEGARGVARTVFRGSEPEEFNVEILGVVPGAIGPHQDMIIGRLSGALAERTFVFAGMSGSPVYIDGKLIGAVAYSFPFAKEPICGITPIEQMISIFERVPAPKPASAARPIKFSDINAAAVAFDSPRPFSNAGNIVSGMATDSRMSAVAGQTFVPISTPMTFSGISQSTLDMFAPQLRSVGIMPVASLGGGNKITPLKQFDDETLLGGDSVVVQLARGDISIAAAGTVTLRDKTKIYAFGHPYFGLGSTDLPMAESHVVVVVPNANNSFKLAVADDAVGTLTQDRATGIFGTLGQAPKMIPVKVAVSTSRGRNEEIRFETCIDDFLSPLVVNVGALNAISAQERGIGDTTITLTGTINIRGEEPIRIERRFTGNQAPPLSAAASAVPLALLLKSNLAGIDVTGVELKFSVVEGSRAGALERVAVDRTQVRAGESLTVDLFIRTEGGKLETRSAVVQIPANAPAGPMSLMIGDGSAIQENAAIKQFLPATIGELVRTINLAKRPDRLYVYGYRTVAGAVIGANEMPNLPPSMLATINNDRSVGGTKAATQRTVIDQMLSDGESIVSGSQTIAIEVIR
ncbi:MAG: hypothetical protein K1X36_11835 [Pyrinomonadaceae bacterium]|nr:hypothetical protein [Pyrinomonadaceae bacterium]